jgi:3-phosphoshikimate 1-carboxyvinyltransferase
VPLPDLIEIVPLDKPVQAEITVPGSKSITNRALILAALTDGETVLQGALWSEDTQVMVEALRRLGFAVKVEQDLQEFCNRTITVKGLGGGIPTAGTAEKPLELFVGNAGTAARFLAALVCLGQGVYRLHGVARMHERPQAALFQALRELGYRIDSPNDRLPTVIHGCGPLAGACRVSIAESSQFASALLLSSRRGNWRVEITGANQNEQPYVDMTLSLLRAFPANGGSVQIEPDASSGSYFFGAARLLQAAEVAAALSTAIAEEDTAPGKKSMAAARLECAEVSTISVRQWPVSGWQIDADFRELFFGQAPAPGRQPGGTILSPHGVFLSLPNEISRDHHLGDSIMTAAVLAPFLGQIIRLTDLGRLRVQESERVVGLRTELTKCGAEVVEQGDTLTIFPSAKKLHGAEIETYNDHRMAMCFAILGLKVPGIKIKNPSCVKKTFPNFFQKLAAPSPHGLGAEIRDGKTGKRLAVEELFAN